MNRLPLRLATYAGAALLAVSAAAAPAFAVPPRADRGAKCLPGAGGSSAARGGGWNGQDHRELTQRQIARIEARTQRLLAAKAAAGKSEAVKSDAAKSDKGGNGKGKPGGGGGGGNGGGGGSTPAGATIPVYVHVMAAADGTGDVTDDQITKQIAVLNATYGGQDPDRSSGGATGFTFTLAGKDRFYNDTWHHDRASSTYRSQTRQGEANALNIWLVDFDYLGVATFPWDYKRNSSVDGIRVHYGSLPGGLIADYDQGETATHEAGHWLGLYHTFQGGCTTGNDQVADTPAQATSSYGCPADDTDTCTLPGFDPVHNYMDYSFDSCYWEFTAGQKDRMQQSFAAYRAP